jgi:probable HAF family extracellular repeat protein
MFRLSSRSLLLAAACCTCGAAAAKTRPPTTYTYVTIAAPSSLQTSPVAINTAGTVVGAWYDFSFTEHGFVYKDGTFTSFDYPNATGTSPEGISPSGTVVGSYTDSNYVTHGFTYEVNAAGKPVFKSYDFPGGSTTSLAGVVPGGKLFGVTLGAGNTQELFSLVKNQYTVLLNTNTPIPLGFSSNGMVAGEFAGASFGDPTTAFVYSGGTTTTIPLPPNETSAVAYGVNAKGTVVGFAENANFVYSGFVYSNGTVSTFTQPGQASGYLTGINNKGVMTGVAFDSNFNETAYTYYDGVFSPLTVPGGSGTGSTAINAAGQVLGYTNGDSGPVVFVATPVP